jgi:hypothetical protein
LTFHFNDDSLLHTVYGIFDKPYNFCILTSFPSFRAVALLVEVLRYPDGATDIFHGPNPSGRPVALGLVQPLTEMSTWGISWEVKAAVE